MAHLHLVPFALAVLVKALAYEYYPYSDIEISAKEAFEQNDLVPEFVPSAPESTASVTYPHGTHRVDLGNELEFDDTVIAPTVDWDADSECLYTLIMIDPDAPTPLTRSLLSPLLHWLIINIPGNDVKGGETCAPYQLPTPAPGPAHRYTFVIYKQRGRVNDDLCPVNNSVARERFSIQNYTNQHHISGPPVAGNFFFEEFLPY